AHRVVPAQLALVHQQGQGRGGKRLGAGGQGEDGVGGDGGTLAGLANAVAGEVGHLAALDDDDGSAGALPGAARLLDPGGEVGVGGPSGGTHQEREQSNASGGHGSHTIAAATALHTRARKRPSGSWGWVVSRMQNACASGSSQHTVPVAPQWPKA